MWNARPRGEDVDSVRVATRRVVTRTVEVGAGFEKTSAVGATTVRWVGIAIDCTDAGPVARFYERLLGFEIGDFEPPHWAQLWDLAGGPHINIQGATWYEPPTWPERPGEQAKKLQYEFEVDDLDTAVATALDAGGTEAPWQSPDRNRERIRVMLDPAGHPICLFLRGE
jgi:predicted enzyme related to lactoylglutathione lyase